MGSVTAIKKRYNLGKINTRAHDDKESIVLHILTKSQSACNVYSLPKVEIHSVTEV